MALSSFLLEAIMRFHNIMRHTEGRSRAIMSFDFFIWRAKTQRGPIMIFTNQDRSYRCVTLSAAKGLARGARRCFASLSMTTHDRLWSLQLIIRRVGGGSRAGHK